MSFSFGSNNNNTSATTNNWGASTGFGRRASVGGPLSSSTTAAPNTNQLLFGNTASKPGGLFGNLNNTTAASTAGSGSGGLFGNTSTGNTGLFGNSATATNNNTGATSTGSTGLFGNSNTTNTGSTGLFGSSNTTTSTGNTGLFGNSQTGAASSSTSTGLFGSKPATTTGGLFGNSSNQGSTGLFGGFTSTQQQQQQQPTSGGLFGGSSNSGGLFGAQQNQAPSLQLTVNNSNPYSYSQVLSNLQASSANMPESVTTSVFPDMMKGSNEKKRRFSYLEKPETHKPKSSLLSKLGQTFRLIRNGNAAASFESLKGLFTSNDELKPQQKRIMLSAAAASSSSSNSSSVITPKTITKPSYRAVDARRIGSMKRLIIKTKPMKYHMINVNKVFNAKRRKVITQSLSADKLLTERFDSQEEESDDELEDEGDVALNKAFSRYSYKAGKTFEDSASATATRIVEKTSANENEVKQDDSSNLDELHDGYWSTPTIKQLSEMNIDQLSSLDNFIIGRVGCGQIAYNYPVDLSQVYLDAQKKGIPLEKELFGSVIKINSKFILAYSEDTNKPAMGFGLNVPATITLEGVKPKPNMTIDDHINYLKKQIGMEFITYDPITCVWVFKVKHFSIWGLIDEEDADLKDLLAMKRKQDVQELEASAEYSRLYENDKIQLELKKQKLNEQNKIVPGGWTYTIEPSDDPLSIKRRLVSDEISKQLIKYRSEQSTDELSEQISDITIESDKEPTPVPRVAEYIHQMTNVLPPDLDLNEVVSEKVYEPHVTNEVVFDSIQIRPNLPTSDDWLLQLELANQMTSALAPFVTKPKTKNDPLSIQKIDDILFSDFNQKSMNVSTPTKQLSPIDDMDESEEIFNDNIPTVFGTLLSQSKVTNRGNSYPMLKDTIGFQFKDLVTPGQEKEENDIVTLASALFDDVQVDNSTDPNVTAALVEKTRKGVFGDWLRNFNCSDVEKLLVENKSDPLETVFIYLCAGDLTKAIQAAIDANCNHLSVVVTLSDANDVVVRSIAKNQLDSWTTRNTINRIPKAIVKIYQLLAGEFEQIIDGLSWNLGLALKLFYGDFKDIKTLITEFKDSLPHESPITDIFTLYIDGVSLSSIKSTCLNTKLKWFVLKILATGFTYDDITKEFGKYLASNDYWKEGVLTFATLTNDEEAKEAIRDLVVSKIQFIKSTSVDKEQYVLSVLKLPRVIIYEAVALQKNKEKDYWGECEAFLEVELWEKAHATIVDQLGPATVLSNSNEDKSHLLKILKQFPSNGLIIPDWNKGAGIFEKYLSVLSKNDKDYFEDLEFLLSYLPFVKTKSFDQKVAANLISKKVGNLTLENIKFDASSKSKVLELPLGTVDKRYFELRLSN